MDSFFIFCAEYLIYIAIIITLLRAFFYTSRKISIAFLGSVGISVVIARGVSVGIKYLVHHPRPDAAFALIGVHDPYSFPSGHATFMFALATSVYFFDKKMGIALYLLALLTGISRVYVGVHYWYDIVAGLLFGVVVAYAISYMIRRFKIPYLS